MYVAVPAASYVGKLQLTRGPSVPVVTIGTQGVLVPGGRVFRISVWGGGGLAVCTLNATDPSGRWFAYTDAHLMLRVVDTRTGRVWALGKGCAPIWGAGGLAYMSTDDVNPPDGNPRSRIVVRTTPLAAGTVWATGPVRPLMWAGHRLLFGGAGVLVQARLEVASRPGRARDLPFASRPAVARRQPLAVSPDGSRVLVVADVTGASGAHLYLKELELIDTQRLRLLATLVPTGFDGVRSAVWIGEDIVVSNQTIDNVDNRPNPALARLTAAGDHLRVTQVTTTTVAHGLNAEFDWYQDLQGIGDGRLVAVHQQQNGPTLVTCTIAALHCTRTIQLY